MSTSTNVENNVAIMQEERDILAKKHAINFIVNSKIGYWDSPEAIHSIFPATDENVKSRLVRHGILLGKVAYNDDALTSLIPDIENITEITSKQRESSLKYCIS